MSLDFSDHKILKSADKVEKLQINFNPSTHIFPSIGKNFKNLKQVEIGEKEKPNTIKFINRSDFSGLSALESLVIYNAHINSIPDDVFWDLTALTFIELSNVTFANFTDDFSENIFSKNSKLETIRLRELF